MSKPVVTQVPNVKQPVIPVSLTKSKNWAFSFRYFNQIEHFGLDRVSERWFVSVINRLKDLCLTEKEEFFRDVTVRDRYRYHAIDWNARNIPISRNDFVWIDKDILNNEEDFPFLQFHISKALGRVIGFWNEDSTLFYIVLLDPMHNMQPSNYNSYKVRTANPLSCEYSSLLLDIEALKNLTCGDRDCAARIKLKKLPTLNKDTNIFFFSLDDSYSDALKARIKQLNLSEIIELGLLSSNDQ